jgi:hypothetical protein
MVQHSPLWEHDNYMVPFYGVYEGFSAHADTFFYHHPQGLMLLNDFSPWMQNCQVRGNVLSSSSFSTAILVQPVFSQNHLTLCAYRVPSSTVQEKLKSVSGVGKDFYFPVKDASFYRQANLNDPNWLAGTWLDAQGGRKTLMTQIGLSAQWLVEQDSLQKVKAALNDTVSGSNNQIKN